MTPLRRAVAEAWFGFNARHEAVIYHLYPDSKGLVTAAVGNLADPLPLAQAMPLRRADGSLASADEIEADWLRVKHLPDGPRLGAPAAAKVVQLHLTRADVEALVASRRDANAAALEIRFPGFASWPASAQMAVRSLAWAAGSNFDFPLCAAALARGDFETAADEVKIDEQKTKGVTRRNLANRAFLLAAARCVAEGGDLEHLDLTPAAEPPADDELQAADAQPTPEQQAAYAYALGVLLLDDSIDDGIRAMFRER
jgi:hypothetical protein